MQGLVLLCDIGNSRTKCIESEGGFLLTKHVYNTQNLCNELTIPDGTKCIIISCVNQTAGDIIRDRAHTLDIPVYEIKREITPSIKTRYNLDNIGADRLVNIYIAVRLYLPPLYIISIGTALTIDFIDKNKMHVGGIIVPGPRILRDAILRGTSLPDFDILSGGIKLATNTRTALENGISITYNAIISTIRQQYGDGLGIFTGGFSSFFARDNDIVFPELTIQGLLSIYEEQITLFR